ncbi:MAG: hypothetical protein COV91_04865 [Candidatus Taylorbacteria bacterium CG11_big_fil_rev_8_21_14_0_20_46_11]|uniref:Uncharacterized protein n=1 Tax=Candidatus Taylorbacteria bacterium CG11_big_fil_rev_8_21_14_0_20_46_11 TaxID=1975025 RepID=A0A2H0KAL8_9BACT|nr:MAG: hypothetical protein COV91_04865 [Candidatus Taylorbacteria bacterium CG11_big_fil_rev_8_21_14_0_20_46_11]
MEATNKTAREQKYYKDFPIMSVCRADLESAGFDTTNVDDDMMSELASKMANAYCDLGFWQDIRILAEYLKIKKQEKCV